ncbi:hypothetical protein CY34DRAFT_804682 [Suillus luteus UH-Slu-Lm8-n1]|uniref:Uncharacterized protein n=1 Tax=Suillus luteus UH-Slu-Lm8-n1 TaxID=930992 RepID=A0A0D0B8B1_9AGAM|nr:hypothetical protein CY34DRAFT_804682 [Suillus luteus UH-Slu-Lm8-n1]
MRFSSAIAVAVVTALASSASARCDLFCLTDSDCNTCGSLGGVCGFVFCYGLWPGSE